MGRKIIGDTNQSEIETPVEANDVEALKKLVEQLLEQNTKLHTELLSSKQTNEEVAEKSNNKFESEEDQFDIDPKSLFKIMSLTVGGLNLKTNNVRPLRLPDYGSVRTVTFDDLRVISDLNIKAAREGKFFIMSEKAVKALYLEDVYQSIVNRKVIDEIVTKSTSEIEQVIKTVSKSIKKTIADRIVNGIIENDSKYNDRNKIKFIGDLIGHDLYEVAGELEKTKR